MNVGYNLAVISLRSRMPLHLLKMCVGINDLDHLRAVRKARRATQPDCLVRTRNLPKRADEVLDGGSIYWVIKGYVRARQRILEISSEQGEDGQTRCALHLDHEIVATGLQPRKPFQGWRYLEAADAPPDAAADDGAYDFPPEMARELRELGLL
jgi:hypothetical protein